MKIDGDATNKSRTPNTEPVDCSSEAETQIFKDYKQAATSALHRPAVQIDLENI